MIVVRWMIPDMSADLRDRIRREAYVINEIIINKERQRAGLFCKHGNVIKSISRIVFSTNFIFILAPTSGVRDAGDLAGVENVGWDRLMSREMSGSEFDLATLGTNNNVMEPTNV